MIVTLCTERIRTLDDIRAFLDGNVAADITPTTARPPTRSLNGRW